MIPYSSIIQGDSNDERFTNFCNALLAKSEQITLLGTSKTWDLGRDGVSIRKAIGYSHGEIVCCTTTADDRLDEKVVHDGQRLASTTEPQHVFYCSSRDLSEYRQDQLSSDLRNQVGTRVAVTFLDAKKLAQLSERYTDVFRSFYPGEVADAEQAFAKFASPPSTAETRGLRLALLAYSDDAHELRRQISKRAILDVLLSLPRGCSAGAVAHKLSSDLGLPRPVSGPYTESILQSTTLAGLTRKDEFGCWVLTEEGKAEAESVPIEAAQDIISGRTVVKKGVEELVGTTVSDAQWSAIWSTLLDFFSEYFYTSGYTIVSAVSAFLDASSPTPATGLEKLIEEGARKASAPITTRELKAQVEQAIKDVFTERSGPAFDWLSRLCERFVALCAMGFEGTSADEIRGVLIRHRFVLDTDVVLTVLCDGEPDHQVLRELLTRFRQIGGRVVLAPPVLEEVAYHAFIAEREFRENEDLFGKLGPEELRRYLKNTFVRAFFMLGWQKKAKPSQWPIFINQYKGSSARDGSRVMKYLQPLIQAERLPELMDESLRDKVTSHMVTALAKMRKVPETQLGRDDLGKARTDGRLIGALAAARDNLREQGSGDTFVLLTSSSRLQRADLKFRDRLGLPSAVVLPGALSYLLALIPGVHLGVSTLRRALFEFRESGRLADTNRLALRVLRSTELYDIPWATRGTLEEMLETNLKREASRQGLNVAEIEKRFIEGDDSVRPAQLILDAVRDMAYDNKAQRKLQEANRRIDELEEHIRRTKERGKR